MKKELASQLYDSSCVQFGTFTLKSGLMSPIYVDLRLLVSHPPLLQKVARVLAQAADQLTFDRIAAIPYAGIPIGTAMALEMNRPMIYPRQQIKEHGTRRAIEGTFEPGEIALVEDDLITRGTSKIEAIAPLEEAGLSVRDVLVLIDREQGGAGDLAERGHTLHTVFRLADILDVLRESERITAEQHADVLAYLKPER